MNYCAEIIAVGTEILLGDIVNTDAQTVARALSELGINVYYNTVVGDNPERLRAAVEIAKDRADIIITTGGLGPTFDDLTKQTLAECFGKKLVLNERELQKIKGYFEKLGRTMTKNNEQQAYLPEDCTVLENDWGTAPGCAFFAENTHVLMLPGPPRECVPMMRERAMPYLKKLSDACLVSHEIKIFGMGESSVEDKIRHIAEKMTNPTLAPYAKEGETLLRVTGRAGDESAADALTRPVIDQVYEILGDCIYGTDVPSLAFVVLETLKKQGKTIATAESCTGGLLSKMLTDLPGASDAFLGGICAYQNEIKEKLLYVPHELLEKHGAVSEECAAAMAEGVRKALGADIGVGITGIAGPGGGSEEKPVGTVYIAVSDGVETRVKKVLHQRDRGTVRNMSALTALDQVRRILEK
ncbi:MAG: competence/damage-inducible protein A [Ruminococcaceae bacterium]|nr:competence/damage-inducible protein A [Oscillospiraceae bacterium]